jgi:hypothetical protein
VATHKLGPNKTRSFTHHCNAGERLLRSGTGVGFFKPQPASARELHDLDVKREERGGRIHVTVRTGSTVGDDEKVRLQIHALCRS